MFIHRKKREQKKAVQAAISKAKRTDKKEKSSQDSIPYLLMRPDGICQVTQNHYTKTSWTSSRRRAWSAACHWG